MKQKTKPQAGYKLIILRGLPGCGKTTIAKHLQKTLPDSLHIEVDKLKQKYIKEHKHRIKNSREYAYKETITLLSKINKKVKHVIIDEIGCDKDFIVQLQDTITNKNIQTKWFFIDRPTKELIEIENKRKKWIKNSKQDFKKLKKEILSQKIKNQTTINNNKTY